MIKVADTRYEWVLLHIRNGEQFVGLVQVPDDLDEEGNKFYSRCLAADLMQSKVQVDTGGRLADCDRDGVKDYGPIMNEADRIIELRNPHQVVTGVANGQPTMATMPLNLGDRIIFIRAGEVLYVQFLDDKSPIVMQIRRALSDIVTPNESLPQTASGIIVPGAK